MDPASLRQAQFDDTGIIRMYIHLYKYTSPHLSLRQDHFSAIL